MAVLAVVALPGRHWTVLRDFDAGQLHLLDSTGKHVVAAPYLTASRFSLNREAGALPQDLSGDAD